MKNKIVIIGCGKIGMGYAYSLLTCNTCLDELVLIDIDNNKAVTNSLDLNYCLAYNYSKVKIHAGTYSDCKDAKIVVIASGSNQNIGETKMDLVYKNCKIFKQIIDQVLANNFNGIFLIATNPSEVLTTFALKYSKFNPSKVIGLGTSFNTVQLKHLLKAACDISIENIEAYVIGESGEFQFVPWSIATSGLYSISESLSNIVLKNIEEEIKKYSYNVAHKNEDYAFFIGMTLVEITNAILENKKTVLTVCNYDSINDVCISMPAKIGIDGVMDKRWMKINEEEQKKLIDAISSIKLSLDSISNEYE